MQEVAESPEGYELQQNGYNSQEVKEAAKQDLDFFALLSMPEVAKSTFPPFYLVVWSILTTSLLTAYDFTKLALGFPRGHAKTTVIKLAILWAILFSKKKYILVIGANEDKAIAIISDVMDMLSSYNIQEVFGNWKVAIEKNTQDMKIFSFNGRPVILQAVGQGTAIRGTNQKNARPDFIIFDDAQTKECAESITEAVNFQKWFSGTALKAKSPEGCTTVYIGNMYPDKETAPNSGIYTCVLRNLQKASSWTSFIVGAILEDFTALWEEVHSLERLLQELQDDIDLGQAATFFSEVLNDPNVTFSYYLDPDKVPAITLSPESVHQGSYIVIDPATSKATPDQIVIAYYEIYDEVPHCVEINAGKFTAPETCHNAIEMASRYGCSLICVESNAYQYSLCEWMNFCLESVGAYGINVQDIYNGGKSKNSRILRLFQALMKKELLLTGDTRSKTIHQAIAFNPAKMDNVDDILDTHAMALTPIHEYRHLMSIPGDFSVELMRLPTQLESPSPTSF